MTQRHHHPESQSIAENRRGTKSNREYMKYCRGVENGEDGGIYTMRLDAMLASRRAVKKVIAKLEHDQWLSDMAGRMQRRIARNLMSAYSESLEHSMGG